MTQPIILFNGMGSVQRLRLHTGGGLTIEKLTVAEAVHLDAAQVALLIEHLPLDDDGQMSIYAINDSDGLPQPQDLAEAILSHAQITKYDALRRRTDGNL